MGQGETMCLSIDILKSEKEVFDIGYTSELSTSWRFQKCFIVSELQKALPRSDGRDPGNSLIAICFQKHSGFNGFAATGDFCQHPLWRTCANGFELRSGEGLFVNLIPSTAGTLRVAWNGGARVPAGYFEGVVHNTPLPKPFQGPLLWTGLCSLARN